MSSLLLPVIVESCPSGLRERRRSSVNPLSTMIATSTVCPYPSREESAVVDDLELTESATPSVPSTPIIVSPTETVVQLPDFPSKLISAQHYHAVDADQPL